MLVFGTLEEDLDLITDLHRELAVFIDELADRMRPSDL